MGVASDSNSLEVLFGETCVSPFDILTFGRAGDVVLDANDRYLHRVCGEFVRDGHRWSLHNRGSQAPLRLFASDGVHAVIPPGGHVVLGAPTGTVLCRAGPRTYDLMYRLAMSSTAAPRLPPQGPETAIFGAPLTARETDFMLAFAEPSLTNDGRSIPTYAEVALAFGVSPKTVDTTLQRLRKKLAEAGVENLPTTSALVNHLIACGKVTYGQLMEARSRGGDFEGPA